MYIYLASAHAHISVARVYACVCPIMLSLMSASLELAKSARDS